MQNSVIANHKQTQKTNNNLIIGKDGNTTIKAQSNNTNINNHIQKQLLTNKNENQKIIQKNTQKINQQNGDKALQYNEEKNLKKSAKSQKFLNLKTNQQILEQVNRWRYLNQILQKKREIGMQMQKRKQSLDKQKQLQQHNQKIRLEQEAKRLRIKKKLDQIQQRKAKRLELLENQKQNYKKVIEKQPLFQQKQKEFQRKMFVEQSKIKENILKKKQQMVIDMEQIKKHEAQFLNHLKQRFKRKQQTKKSKSKSPKGKQQYQNQIEDLNSSRLGQKKNKREFKIFLNGDHAQKERDKQKYIRRKIFEQKIRKMPIIIDIQKQKQALITKDKSKNPLKYNYLSNMGLSDEKILEQFKDFEININQKQLGNDYMTQIHRKIPEYSRIRSQSQSQLKPIDKIEYKNYLPQIKPLLKRKTQKKQPKDQVQQILYHYQHNSDRLAELNQRSQLYRKQVLNKIMQIKNASTTTSAYSDYLGKQKQIDDLYMRSIKMKLATVNLT